MPAAAAAARPQQRRARALVVPAVVVLALVVLVTGAYLALEQYQVASIARVVRKSFSSQNYEAARAAGAVAEEASPRCRSLLLPGMAGSGRRTAA